MSRRRSVGICGAVLALALAACGGSGSGATATSTTSASLSLPQLQRLGYVSVLPTVAEAAAAFPGGRVNFRPAGGGRRLGTVCGRNPSPDPVAGAGKSGEVRGTASSGDVGIVAVAAGFLLGQAEDAFADATRLGSGCRRWRSPQRRELWVAESPPKLDLGIESTASAARAPASGTRRVTIVMRSGQLAASLVVISQRRVSQSQLEGLARPMAVRLRDLGPAAG